MAEIVIFLLSLSILLFYLQATCERILQRQFEREFFHAIGGLGFPCVRKALEDFDASLDYPRFSMHLKCDYLALICLLKKTAHWNSRLSGSDRALAMYFRMLSGTLPVMHLLKFGERATLLKMTAILEYLANVAGEHGAWRMEIDVAVEDNGTVFLVYPLSDVAREWFDTDVFRNTQRLGDIQFVERRHLYGLIEAMLDSGLWVVWSRGSLIDGNISGKGQQETHPTLVAR